MTQPNLDDVELVMLRRFQEAHKLGDEFEMRRLSTALDVFRESLSTVESWYGLEKSG